MIEQLENKVNWFNRDIESLIENILDEIEEAGMLPPTIGCDKWVDAGEGQGFVVYEENEWED